MPRSPPSSHRSGATAQRARVFALAVLTAVAAIGCAGPVKRDTPPPATPAPVPPRPSPVPPAPAVVEPPGAFAEVVARAGERLLQDARGVVGAGPRELVIDPLLDASSGQQTTATALMGQQLASLLPSRAPQWKLQPLSRGVLARKPLLLIGTLTPVHTGDARAASADAFRVCLVVIDLASGKLVAKRVDRATVATVNAEPTPFYRDSPTWALDKTTLAYIKSCQGSSPGDAMSAEYLARLPAQALIREAQVALADNRTPEALRLFNEAAPLAARDDLRVLNGLYLASWRSGKRKEAAEAFGRIVGVGLETRRLPIKMLFAPGSTRLIASADLRAQYAMWLREIAVQAGVRETCMRVVGHTSRTGSVAGNDALSKRRAAAVREGLELLDKALAGRLEAVGVGSRETIVDLGTDDARDALDRRVEFRTVDCA